jgi:arylsulfatase A
MKPNIVYILADDMGYGDVSCLNPESKIHTKNMDDLAEQGIYFTDAHASSAVCTPSRYSILTGRYNWRSELKDGVTWGDSPHLMEDGRMTVASFLKEFGYHSACIGKWHLGLDWAYDGENIDFSKPITNGPCTFGFDEYFGISASLDMPPYVYIENDHVTAIPDQIIPERVGKEFYREGLISHDFQHDDVLPKLTTKAIDYINRQVENDSPFFLYFPLPAPHTPIMPSPEFQGKSGTNEYGDFCLMIDDLVGKIMTTLENAGIAENTILIYTSDNGCSPMADFSELASVGHAPSYHFRGHKADIYDGGHRIPLLMKWPAKIQPHSVCDDIVCLSDLLATCADIMGTKLPDNAGEDSVSNLPLWLGNTNVSPIREATVHHSIDGSFSIRQRKWKLELCPGSGGWSWPRPGVECEGLPPIQLYNMVDDVSEKQNVYDKYPEIVEQLTALLATYVRNGRSTPGAIQQNTGPAYWPQLHWLEDAIY